MIEKVSKEELIELIEAYAVAKKTENTVLITMAVGAVKQVIERLYSSDDGFGDPELEPTPRATAKRAS